MTRRSAQAAITGSPSTAVSLVDHARNALSGQVRIARSALVRLLRRPGGQVRRHAPPARDARPAQRGSTSVTVRHTSARLTGMWPIGRPALDYAAIIVAPTRFRMVEGDDSIGS